MTNRSARRLFRFGAIVLMGLLSTLTATAKSVADVVVLKNGDRMTGEIKGLQRGELRFKSDYMAEAVRLDWSKVESLESKSTFMIWLVDGKLVTDVMRLVANRSNEPANFVIGNAQQTVRVHQLDVIRITPADRGFWRRLEGSIDFGLSFTSGNDQYQTNLTATTTYRTGAHSFTASVDSAFSGQTEGTSTTRNQFSFDYRRQLNQRWYVGGLLDFLRSDQQSLRLRSSAGGLIGRNLKQTEHTRLSVFGGLVGAREHYSAELGRPRTTNADALAGVDFFTFRFSKTDIRSRLSVFPSLTTPGRTRLQTTSDLRIKIVKDLWWGFHIYENFDSKPPVAADKNDLGVSTTLGWKF
ncbi:MAG TPA: DUF481 domain-containing protein [Pyrinomonadaceae bacterium]|nr:DUF481 domain-containing protein [Pyrinomonadaceae bacterium]